MYQDISGGGKGLYNNWNVLHRLKICDPLISKPLSNVQLKAAADDFENKLAKKCKISK